MSPLDVVIVGAGPAGISAAIWAQTLKLRYAVVDSGSVAGGQLHRVFNRVLDYPGLPSENGAALAERLRHHAAEVGVSIRSGATISTIDLDRGVVATIDADLEARFVVLATGVRARTLGVPGEAELVGRGISPSASRDAELFRDGKVLVVGGGDAAFEEALILATVCRHVTLIHRSDRFTARPDLRARVADDARIWPVESCELEAIGGTDRVERAQVRTSVESWTIDVDGVFICVGVMPNSELVANHVARDDQGYVTVDARMRSSHARLYAVGDVRAGSSLTIAAAIGEGAAAIKDIQRRLTTGEKKA